MLDFYFGDTYYIYARMYVYMCAYMGKCKLQLSI